MHIDLNDAIRIHARVGRARFGRGAKKRALKTAEKLRLAGDHTGAAVWERLATEIDRTGGNKIPPPRDAGLVS
jgi:hypothetical protein